MFGAIKSLWDRCFSCKPVIASVCGHEAEIDSKVMVFGQEMSLKLNRGNIPYCPDCLAKMSIRCAWCGESILVGDPITLYTPARDDFKVPEYAVVYREKPLQLVGCLRWGCADTGADRSGFWIVPGRVERVLSPIEQAMLNGEGVIYEDVTDRARTIKIEEG